MRYEKPNVIFENFEEEDVITDSLINGGGDEWTDDNEGDFDYDDLGLS